MDEYFEDEWFEEVEDQGYEEEPEGRIIHLPVLFSLMVLVIVIMGYTLWQEGYFETQGAAHVVAAAPAFGVSTCKSYTATAKISWYNPALIGPNCAKVVNKKCVSNTASGDPWPVWMGKGCACPKEFAFNTVFVVNGQRWVCRDRGGKIKMLGANYFWLDLMAQGPPLPFGTDVVVEVHPPCH